MTKIKIIDMDGNTFYLDNTYCRTGFDDGVKRYWKISGDGHLCFRNHHTSGVWYYWSGYNHKDKEMADKILTALIELDVLK